MRVLVLEPFYGGSHREFLDQWQGLSRHRLTLFTLSAHHWKWRMRHSVLDFAQEARRRFAEGERWDAVFCTDMLNLAELRGLAPELGTLPSVVYFHENQLTYPVQEQRERDRHFAFTNLTTAVAADAVWWNSAFHRDDFLGAAASWLRRLPDHRPLESVRQIADKSEVFPQGIRVPTRRREGRPPGPLRILWAGRWEFDKNPEGFFAVIETLEARGVDYRLSVIGERFRDCPAIFDQAQARLEHRLDAWGFQESRTDYERVLGSADVFVSTAHHEFFGVAAAEAIAAGCLPLLPNRLAYPDLLAAMSPEQRAHHLYETDEDLELRLVDLAGRASTGRDLWPGSADAGQRAMEGFHWPAVCRRLDDGMERLVGALPSAG